MFFAFVIDVFSRMIVGWQLATHMRTTLVLDAPRMVLGLRVPGADVALVHHSDRGSQYTSPDYVRRWCVTLRQTNEAVPHSAVGPVARQQVRIRVESKCC